MDDIILWRLLVTGAGIIITALLGLLFSIIGNRLKKHEDEDRENFRMLFTGQGAVKDQISAGFSGVRSTISDMHVDILKELARKQDKPVRYQPNGESGGQ